MPKILAALAVVATAAFLALPSPAQSAPQSPRAETDQAATTATDISSHRRRYRHRHYRRYYSYRPYYAPAPYSYGYYRPYPYRYWGPPPVLPLFPFGPWW